MLPNGKPLGNVPTAELIERGVEADSAERERIRAELNGRPRPLSPLRRARAEVVLGILSFHIHYGMSNSLSDVYGGARWRGLSRAQTDRAIEDLIATGQVTVVGTSSGVEVRLTEVEQERRRA